MTKKTLAIASIALASFTLGFVSKPAQETNLGTFSISLSVKDIKASSSFYEKLGFQQVPGSGGISQRWMIMQHADIKIGLFQGMFPTNTLTFNPGDARAIHTQLATFGISPTFSTGLDKEKGPCSFSILDPDSNPILIDQH